MKFSKLTTKDICSLVSQTGCEQYYFCGKRIDVYYSDNGEIYSYYRPSKNKGLFDDKNSYSTLLQAMKAYRDHFDDGDDY
jgi:hypothetical protein